MFNRQDFLDYDNRNDQRMIHKYQMIIEDYYRKIRNTKKRIQKRIKEEDKRAKRSN